MRPQRAGVAAMVLATLLWGSTFVVIRDSLSTLPPLLLVFGRFAVAAVAFAVLLLVRRRRPDRNAVIAGVASAPFVAACYLLQATGLTTIAAGSSAFLTAAGTLGVAFVAWVALGQRPGRAVIGGIALALVGSAVMSWRGPFGFGLGELMTLAGALAYTVHLVIVSARIRDSDPIALVAVLSLTVSLLLAPFAVPHLHVFARLPPEIAWRFGYLAIAATVVAPVLQVSAQRVLPPARIGLMFALEPVFGVAIAVLLGAERFDLRWWAGALLILSAVVWVEARAASSASAPRATAAIASTPPGQSGTP